MDKINILDRATAEAEAKALSFKHWGRCYHVFLMAGNTYAIGRYYDERAQSYFTEGVKYDHIKR